MPAGGGRQSAGREPAPPRTKPEQPSLSFGVLGRPHGTRGEIFLAPYNPDANCAWLRELPTKICWAKGERVLDLEVVASRPVKDGLLVRFASADSREAVAELVGGEVKIERDRFPALSSDEIYVEDMVGFEVRLPDGGSLGKVRGAFWNGAHDVMCIVGADGEERFLPVLPGFVLSFDAAARLLTVDPHD
jgi:16S rRNA processing protein RimM